MPFFISNHFALYYLRFSELLDKPYSIGNEFQIKRSFAMYAYLMLFSVIISSNHCFGMMLSSSNYTIPLNGQHIIFLNGTTTAGKSSIAIALKDQLENQSLSVEICSIDNFLVPKIQLALVMNRLNPWNMFVPNDQLISSESMEKIQDESLQELCMAAKTAYSQKKIVIIDTPAYRSEQINFYHKEFADLNTTWVLVYCPINTLVNRVIQRNQTAWMTDQRSIAQALDQFSHMYSNNRDQSIDILPLDTLFLTYNNANSVHIAMQNQIPDFLKGIQQLICSSSIGDIQQLILEKFKIANDSQVIHIAPDIQLDIPYSAIVNTELHSPELCAKGISTIFRYH